MKRYMLALLLSASLPVIAMEEEKEEPQESKSLCECFTKHVIGNATHGWKMVQGAVDESGIPGQFQKVKKETLEYFAEYFTLMEDEKGSVQYASPSDQTDQNELILALQAELQKVKDELATQAEINKILNEDQQS